MPNLVITNHCNLRCPFCFASEYRADGVTGAVSQMSVDELRRQIAFAGVETVRFCGGEPTLHPDLTEMLDLALAPELRRVFVMTNGLWPDEVRRHVGKLGRSQRSRLTYLVNVLEPTLCSEAERQRLAETLSTIDPDAATIGFTIHRPAFDPLSFVALAERFGIRSLRYSVAAPTVTDPGSWSIVPERDFPGMAKGVLQLLREARRSRLKVQSDCGYVPPCMFTSDELAELAESEPAPEFRCHGPVDIGPSGEAWRCYGLYNVMRTRTADFSNGAELTAYFEEQIELFADLLLFEQCRTCELRGNACGGGCHAFRALRGLRLEAERCGIDIGNERELDHAVVEIRSENLQLQESSRGTLVMLRDPDGAWGRLDLDDLEKRALRACDGARTISEILTAVEPKAAEAHTRQVVHRLVRRLLSRQAVTLRLSKATFGAAKNG